MLKNKKIVIVGLGLMGASLGLALRKRYPNCRVIGLSRSLDTVHEAREKKVIHWGTTHMQEALHEADWVVICTPVHTITQFISEIDRLARPGTIVTDVGSAKENILDWADQQKFKNIIFVGSHPMTGGHDRGLDAARPDLYKNALCFVIHGKKTNIPALRKVVHFWKVLCRSVHIVDAKSHDKIAAKISHLPHVVSSLLVYGTDSKTLPFVGPGFKDTTRVSQGDPHLWNEIIRENRGNIERELKGFKKNIDKFLLHLEEDKDRHILKILNQASQKRKKINSSSPS